MKNLKLFSESRAAVNLQAKNEELLVSALDVERNRIFFASSANIIYGINLSASQEMQWTINLCSQSEVGLPPILEAEDRITGLDYLIEQEALIVGTSTGDLVLVVPTSNTVYVVGKVEGGVKTIFSSPDGALLIVATGFGQLLAMTQDWDVLYEVSYDLDNNLEGLQQMGFLAYPVHFVKCGFHGEEMESTLRHWAVQAILKACSDSESGKESLGHCIPLLNLRLLWRQLWIGCPVEPKWRLLVIQAKLKIALQLPFLREMAWREVHSTYMEQQKPKLTC